MQEGSSRSVSSGARTQSPSTAARSSTGARFPPPEQRYKDAPVNGNAVLQKKPRPDPDAILGFLNALNPPQPQILPAFIAMGLTGIEQLHSVNRMTDRDDWLYSWVLRGRVTEFQFPIIRAGFESLADSEPGQGGTM